MTPACFSTLPASVSRHGDRQQQPLDGDEAVAGLLRDLLRRVEQPGGLRRQIDLAGTAALDLGLPAQQLLRSPAARLRGLPPAPGSDWRPSPRRRRAAPSAGARAGSADGLRAAPAPGPTARSRGRARYISRNPCRSSVVPRASGRWRQDPAGIPPQARYWIAARRSQAAGELAGPDIYARTVPGLRANACEERTPRRRTHEPAVGPPSRPRAVAGAAGPWARAVEPGPPSPERIAELSSLLRDPAIQAWLQAQASGPAAPTGTEAAAAPAMPGLTWHVDGHAQLRAPTSRGAAGCSRRAGPGLARPSRSSLMERDPADVLLLLGVFVGLGFAAQGIYWWATGGLRRAIIAAALDTVAERLRADRQAAALRPGLGSRDRARQHRRLPAVRLAATAQGDRCSPTCVVFLDRECWSACWRAFCWLPGAERFRIVPMSTEAAWFWTYRQHRPGRLVRVHPHHPRGLLATARRVEAGRLRHRHDAGADPAGHDALGGVASPADLPGTRRRRRDEPDRHAGC